MSITDEQFSEALKQRGWTVEVHPRISLPARMSGIVGAATLRHAEKDFVTSAEVLVGESLWELAYRKALRAEQGQLAEELRDSLYEEFVKRMAGGDLNPEQRSRNYETWLQIQAIDTMLDTLMQGSPLAELAVLIVQDVG